ncbi:MAG TPA: YigZ family protein [Anaerovoracaceae bacterium]|nr:YigZ family protein [Anaerovoracaceae bacterium]
MKLFSTVMNEAVYEEVINKSRFIAYIKPVESKECADEFISIIKKKHRDAAHNVPAIVIGDKFNIQWASDDGEPQGTAGAPLVNMLVSRGVTNVVIVVTRYFGGIKLGTGGLVRAYTKVAQEAVGEALIADVISNKAAIIKTDYTFLSKIQNIEQEGLFKIIEIKYTDKVNIKISVIEEKFDEIIDILTNITAGNLYISNIENIFIKTPTNT